MDEILQTLAQHTGISTETARNGLGAVLAFLKEHLPVGMFEKLEQSVPGSGGAVDAFHGLKGSEGGGLMGAITGLAGKFLGGGGADVSKLLAMLGSAGLSVSQIQSFLPKAIELLKAHVPPDLLQKIEGMLAGATGGAAPEKS